VTRPTIAFLAIAATLAIALQAPLGEQERNRAGLIVRSGDGDVREMCVLFDEEEITGVDLLERADVEIASEGSALGTAVCSIDGEGCKSDDCFCRYPAFWGYWTKDGSKDWRFSDVGAAARVVRDGSLDGWSFGRDGKPTPPDVTIDEVCGASEATPISMPAPVVRARPSYLPFVAFAGGLGVVAVALAVRRRRRGRSGT
jgi:hypothetical protein